MATFELTGKDGGTYQIEAPNEHIAVQALTHLTEKATPTEAPKESPGILKTVDDYVRAAANGMTFGLADRFAAGMGSATGVGGKSGDYAGNLKNEQDRTGQFERIIRSALSEQT